MPKLTAALALLMTAAPALAQERSTVLHNARIYTAEAEQPVAEALAFEGGRLLAVGAEAELLAAYPEAERLDAGGRTVLPGLIDAHAHLMGLGQALLQADLVGAASAEEAARRVRDFAETLPEGAWVTGRGWDQNLWPGQEFPTAADLDEVIPERPAVLSRIDGHALWANTAAMRAAGLDPEAPAPPDPSGGAILRDEAGRPTGVFVDAAEALLARALPPPSEAEARRRLEAALEATASAGLTGVHEAGTNLDQIALYRAAIAEGRFPIRVYAMIDGEGPALDHFCAEGPLLDHGGRLAVRSVKLYADGALGSRGAALLAPYSDDPGNLGLLQFEPEALEAAAERAMGCGLQVNTHAIGDRGVRVVLDAYEAAIRATGGGPGRHRLEHAQVVAPEDVPRFAAMGLIASMQPTHATSDMGWAEARLGPERLRGAYAWQTLREAGARLALGSDFPVERVSPLLGFYAAVTRQDGEGRPEGGWRPEERLSREEALRGFTIDAAYAAFMEEEVGSLAPGKRADFVVLDRDVMTVPAEEILGAAVVATFLDGEPIYGGL